MIVSKDVQNGNSGALESSKSENLYNAMAIKTLKIRNIKTPVSGFRVPELNTFGEYKESMNPYFERTIETQATPYIDQPNIGVISLDNFSFGRCFFFIKSPIRNEVTVPIRKGIIGKLSPRMNSDRGKALNNI